MGFYIRDQEIYSYQMNLGDFIEVYIVPVKPMFGPGKPEFFDAGIVLEIEKTQQKMTFLSLDGNEITVNLGITRMDYFFDVDVISQISA